jgi:hypothetical protein
MPVRGPPDTAVSSTPSVIWTRSVGSAPPGRATLAASLSALVHTPNPLRPGRLSARAIPAACRISPRPRCPARRCRNPW